MAIQDMCPGGFQRSGKIGKATHNMKYLLAIFGPDYCKKDVSIEQDEGPHHKNLL